MKLKRKYSARRVYFHKESKQTRSSAPPRTEREQYIRFDSLLELDTYLVLKRHFPEDAIKIHQKIDIIADISWVVDFVVSINGCKRYVESKGFITPNFLLKMKLLKHLHPKIFCNVTFVGKRRSTKKGIDIIRLLDFERRIQNEKIHF